MIVLLYVALVPNSTENSSDTLLVSPVEVTSDYIITTLTYMFVVGWICYSRRLSYNCWWKPRGMPPIEVFLLVKVHDGRI